MRGRNWLAGAALLVLLALSGGAQAADTLKVGWIAVPPSLAPILSTKPDLATNLDKTYSIDLVRFVGSSAMITALATGDIDIGELAYASFGLAVQNGHMTSLRIIADLTEDGVEGWLSNGFFVLNDGPIKTIEDLKGKTVATNTIGSGTDIGIRTMLRRHGLEAKRDYTIIESDYNHMIPLLTEHKADMITTSSTVAYDPTLAQVGRVLFHMKDSMGVTQSLVRVSLADTIAKKRAAMVDYFQDEIRVLRWFLDPAHHEDVVTIVATFNKQSPALLDGWLYTHKDGYRDPNLHPNLAAMQSNLKIQKEAGFLDIDLDVKKFADLSMVDEAAARIK
jgi:sulfonate transport system substrate-binding protein